MVLAVYGAVPDESSNTHPFEVIALNSNDPVPITAISITIGRSSQKLNVSDIQDPLPEECCMNGGTGVAVGTGVSVGTGVGVGVEVGTGVGVAVTTTVTGTSTTTL